MSYYLKYNYTILNYFNFSESMILSVALWLLLLIIWWGFNFRYSTKIKPGYTSIVTTEPLLRGLEWNF